MGTPAWGPSPNPSRPCHPWLPDDSRPPILLCNNSNSNDIIYNSFSSKYIIMQVGDKIPEVLGIDQNGNEIKSSDYRGRKIVLYSYPRANTPGCSSEACSLQQHKAELEAAGYAIIGVSRDRQELQKRFADAKNLDFPLIADTDASLLQQLGAIGEKTSFGKRTVGILRTTYLVNEEGIVEKIFTPKEIKTKIHAEQILDYINQ